MNRRIVSAAAMAALATALGLPPLTATAASPRPPDPSTWSNAFQSSEDERLEQHEQAPQFREPAVTPWSWQQERQQREVGGMSQDLLQLEEDDHPGEAAPGTGTSITHRTAEFRRFTLSGDAHPVATALDARS
jgi:hypothetical protein